MTGTTLDGAYKIGRVLGQGGMGSVYEAVQLRLGKRVAVKVMSPDLSANREALVRFRREAEVTSQIGHPNIVQVFDFGSTPSGAPYLVMEYLHGEDLDHRVRKVGRLPLAEAVRIVRQVASALAAAHAKNVVHRDLKPGNVFLQRIEGEADFVKVVDFGISKIKSAATKLTRSSVIMGTPEFMSPEQATGRIDEIDHRTDQWALACIAWEAISGRAPFVGDDVAALLFQTVHQDPPALATQNLSVPAEVERVLRRALSKKKEERFPTISMFAQALEQATSGLVSSQAASAPGKATVIAGGTREFRDDEKTIFDPPPEFGGTELDASGRAGATPTRPTTFSQTTGELRLTRAWNLARQKIGSRRVLPVSAAIVIVVAGSFVAIRRGSAPVSKSSGAAMIPSATTVPATNPAIAPPSPPVVKPMASEPVGVPPKMRTVTRKRKPNPFVESAPVSPTETPVPRKTTPARPKRALIQEL